MSSTVAEPVYIANGEQKLFDLYVSYAKTDADFKSIIKSNMRLLRKTQAFTCPTCEGTAKVYRIKKDGTKFARPNKCKDCEARGYQLKQLDELAGLGFTPPSKTWVSAYGFSTGKDNLDVLIATAKTKKMDMDFSMFYIMQQ